MIKILISLQGYFIVGFSQFLSTIFNIFKPEITKNKRRKLYEKIVLVYFVLAISVFIFLSNIGIYFVLECWQYIANILPIYIPIQKINS